MLPTARIMQRRIFSPDSATNSIGEKRNRLYGNTVHGILAKTAAWLLFWGIIDPGTRNWLD
jgi:hypothetical protein